MDVFEVKNRENQRERSKGCFTVEGSVLFSKSRHEYSSDNGGTVSFLR